MNIIFGFADRADGGRFNLAGSTSPVIDQTNNRLRFNFIFAGTDKSRL
jgi:hypothetical protein